MRLQVTCYQPLLSVGSCLNLRSVFHPCLPHPSLCSCCLLTTWMCVSLVDLLHSLLWAGQNGLPPTPDIFHLGCSYLEDRCHHTVVWQSYCRKLTFRLVNWFILGGMTGSKFVNITPWLGGEVEKAYLVLYGVSWAFWNWAQFYLVWVGIQC